MLARHTKIVATLGPATDQPGVLDHLIAAGLDCARLNCSHGTADDLRRRATEVREAAARAGRPVALMFDLQGPKLRLSSDTEQRVVEVGEPVTFAGAEMPAAARARSASTSAASPTSSPSARRSSSATACRGCRPSASTTAR